MNDRLRLKLNRKIDVIILILFIGMPLLFSSCATSMSPIKVNNTLPILTEATFISQSQFEKLEQVNKCKTIVEGRSYNAPTGFTVNHDLKNAAKGIDEWVELDGGNAYTLISYKWITVDHYGSTQLSIVFNTVLLDN